MNKLLKVLLLSVATLSLSGCFYQKVPAGYVGVKVNMLGSSKGVEQEVVGVGRQWLTWNEELYLFPTFNQLHNYTETFNFQTSDSMNITTRIGVEYVVMPEKVSTIFQTYRKGVDEITSINIRQNISDSLIKHSGKMDINSLPAGGKTVLLELVTEDLRKKLEPIGIKIIKLSWLTDFDYPPQVRESINAKINATQRALLRENEIQQSKAEAQKAIEEARGKAEAVKIAATADADALNLKGEALRNNPEILQLEAIEKWDGKLPQYMADGSSTPFIKVK